MDKKEEEEEEEGVLAGGEEAVAMASSPHMVRARINKGFLTIMHH